MTTSDYLTQLQQDREDFIDNLETKGITGLTGDETFTELVPEVLNISTGADLSEYFDNTPSTISSTDGWGRTNFIKKTPDLIIPNSLTSLSRLFMNSSIVPKIICTDNITDFSFLYSSTYVNEIDVSGLDLTNATTVDHMFFYCSATTIIGLEDIGTIPANDFNYMFQNCSELTSIDLSSLETSSQSNLSFSYTFANCSLLDYIDLSSLEGSCSNIQNMFSGCTHISKIDIRNLVLSTASTYTGAFGGNTLVNIPADCLIIVKDDTEKTWVTSKFSRLTNVQTVAEYEANLNS